MFLLNGWSTSEGDHHKGFVFDMRFIFVKHAFPHAKMICQITARSEAALQVWLCRLMVGKREDAGLDTPVSTGAEMIRM